MMKYLFAFLFLSPIGVWSQYSLQSPLLGHAGIHYQDPRIVNWAVAGTLERGLKHIEQPSLGYAIIGNIESALGAPSLNVLSLGDGGRVTLTFEYPIKNGTGPDFAVFENGFTHLENDTLAFLEVAFVEVSSNGEDFFRFPSISLMQTTEQLVNLSFVDTRYYHNLAGKHIAFYGTPFDLDDLDDHPLLNKNAITHVKIIDVIGSINPEIASRDSQGNIINDPYPTPFPNSGFDLAAIGVLHQLPTNIEENHDQKVLIYPNPSRGRVYVHSEIKDKIATIFNINGQELWQGRVPHQQEWELTFLPHGWYLIRIEDISIPLMIQP